MKCHCSHTQQHALVDIHAPRPGPCAQNIIKSNIFGGPPHVLGVIRNGAERRSENDSDGSASP